MRPLALMVVLFVALAAAASGAWLQPTSGAGGVAGVFDEYAKGGAQTAVPSTVDSGST